MDIDQAVSIPRGIDAESCTRRDGGRATQRPKRAGLEEQAKLRLVGAETGHSWAEEGGVAQGLVRSLQHEKWCVRLVREDMRESSSLTP